MVKPELQNCTRCPRLTRQFKALRVKYPDYWNLPVAASGDPAASILIVGLAPGMHGANRTGQPFVGDASGELLASTLRQLKLEGLVRITNIVKCLPIKNLPSSKEISNCSRFLKAELDAHSALSSPVIVALGGVSHRAIVRQLGMKQVNFPFVHGQVHEIKPFRLVDSYHCSRYNTQTRRLTPGMFLAAIKTAAALTQR